METRAQPACASCQKSCVKMARMLWPVWKQYDLSLFLFVIECIKVFSETGKLDFSLSRDIKSRISFFFRFRSRTGVSAFMAQAAKAP